MIRTRIALTVIALVFSSSLLEAAPTVSVVPMGINPSGNREWSVRMHPDAALFYNPADFPDRGVGGSLAVELAFSVVGSGLGDVDANSTAWPHANPGYNPFTSSYAMGLVVGGGGGGGTSSDGGGSVAPGLPGDYNDNGVVDTADYTIWQDNLGSSFFLANDDTPGVAADDYDRWANNFGNTAA